MRFVFLLPVANQKLTRAVPASSPALQPCDHYTFAGPA
ncbi:MAG: hypothetical protein AVDCRST_MAG56-1956 [uncultured Cytophagales bacterium]|uniref:Uncharacterized protein n=1 Tax=uncultured Cytophagales bacterium TaxID=158755 RepID=A0A6J4II80_9SPHI|nr:MAG: hypothetical protein AVDCRST_MAG56-1956 [uncultured Cytophagales bacterium]